MMTSSSSTRVLNIDSYDWLGFDLDHCLIRYKLMAVNKVIFDGMLQYLTEEKSTVYDAEIILSKYHYDHTWQCRGAVYDKLRGNLLKLDSSKRVVCGSHGLDTLSAHDILTWYPQPLHEFDGDRTARYHPLVTFFDVPGGYLLSVLVDYLDRKFGRDSRENQYSEVFNDLISGYQANFNEYGKGWYFPVLSATTDMGREIGKYIYTRHAIKQWLARVRARGQRVFVLTNSRVDYTNLLLEHTFGERWFDEDLFDIVVTYAQKGAFFKERKPFKDVCLTNLYETNEIDAGDLQPHHVYAQGNAADFHAFLARVSGKSEDDLKVLYHGDHLLTDVRDSKCHTSWTPVAVVEELALFEPPSSASASASAANTPNASREPSPKKPRLNEEEEKAAEEETKEVDDEEVDVLPVSKVWGSYFMASATKGTTSFWHTFLIKHAALVIPDVSYLCTMDSSVVAATSSSSSTSTSSLQRLHSYDFTTDQCFVYPIN